MIDDKRLAATFEKLVRIDSVTGDEREIADLLKQELETLGAFVVIDNAGEKAGSNTGNLIAKFEGDRRVAPLMLNAHMDTVEPGRGINPKLENGIFTSDGTTILGADDKSAVAILLEVLTILRERKIPSGPLEIVLTVCEESGMVGAKHMDFSAISARQGYALDTQGTGVIITRAPGRNQLQIDVYGKSAHAGVTPEQGINAIVLAAKAIATLNLGRIDDETTCNIGMFEGGRAINIVPDKVTVKGEVRSHDKEQLARVCRTIGSAFEAVVADFQDRSTLDDGKPLPRVEISVEEDFRGTFIPDDHAVIRRARMAAGNLGRPLKCVATGGGADANVFFAQGIVTGVLGTGMQNMHSVNESIRLQDMVDTAELVLEIVRLHAEGE